MAGKNCVQRRENKGEGKRKDRESVMGTKLNTKVIKLMIYKKRWCLQKWGINFWIIYEPVRSHIHDPFQSHFFRSWRDLGVHFFCTPLMITFRDEVRNREKVKIFIMPDILILKSTKDFWYFAPTFNFHSLLFFYFVGLIRS